ncbi:MAG: nucleotidyl transferase AbiEii/AbiGii toxin family protein [Candidatus Shapirobacteria bacterium]
MENALAIWKKISEDSSTNNRIFQRNKLKEYGQILVLDFIYAHPKYSQLVFYGGSCLAQCYGLPRLSEDIDLVDLKKTVSLEKLAHDLHAYFDQKLGLKNTIDRQKFRVMIKLPILRELGLAKADESENLLLKIEVFSQFAYCLKFKIEIVPIFKYNRSILVRTFDLPTLMATKINAVLNRQWQKTNKEGKIILRVKGRDYFDLMWYLQKGIKPNLACIIGIKNGAELKEKLLVAVKRVDRQSLKLDLEALIDQPELVQNLSRNLKEILVRQLDSSLAF